MMNGLVNNPASFMIFSNGIPDMNSGGKLKQILQSQEVQGLKGLGEYFLRKTIKTITITTEQPCS